MRPAASFFIQNIERTLQVQSDAEDLKFPKEPQDLSPKQQCIIAWARQPLTHDARAPQTLCRLRADSVRYPESVGEPQALAYH